MHPMPNTLKQALAKENATMWLDYTGADAVRIDITFVLDGVARELWLEQLQDQRQFGMLWRDQESGKATARVRPGAYFLEYRGKAASPHLAYQLAITAPSSAKWKPEPDEEADSHANVIGIHKFTVAP